MTRKQSFRLRHTFWLDMMNHAEQELSEYIETLKAQRTFVKTVRDGLRLMRDLREGRVDVLFELFPLLKAEFIAGVMPKPDNDPSGNEKVQRQLDELKDLLLRSTTPPMVAAPINGPRPLMMAGAAATGPKPLGAPTFDLPRFDDDDTDTLIIAKDTNTDSAQNFLNSMLNLQH